MKLKIFKPLLLISSVFLLFICCKTNDIAKIKNDSQFSLTLDNCSITKDNSNLKIGENIQEWVNTLGRYDRVKYAEIGVPFFSRRDSIYVWDSLGITVISSPDKNESWNVSDIFIFFTNPSLSGINKQKLYFNDLENTLKNIYKDSPDLINETENAFNEYAEEDAKKKNRELLMKIKEDSENVSRYFYPKSVFKGNVVMYDVKLNNQTSIMEINENSKKNNLPLIAYKSKDIYPNLISDLKLVQYYTDEEYKKDINYNKTDISIDGHYGLIKNSTDLINNIVVNNNRVEFITISSHTCN